MKKVLSIVLAIAMIATMSAVAFAANTGSFAGEEANATATSDHEVYGIYATGTRTDMYKVDINWGSMIFTYTESAETWNTTEHTWDLNDDDAVGVWTCEADANKVALANHSSKPVSVALAFDDDVDADGDITGVWTNATVELAACEEGGDAVEGSATLALTGKYLNEDGVASTKIGTVTATIA